MIEKRICKYCGNVFEAKVSAKRKYCSLKCAYASPLRNPRSGL